MTAPTAPASSVSSVPAAAPGPAPTRSSADVAVRRFLRLPDERPVKSSRAANRGADRATNREAHKAFSRSILISATRCLLTYLVLPFLAPALGFAKGVGPWIGIPLGVVAIVFNVLSIRRFWAADHKWRWAYTAIGTSVIVLLSVLIVDDVLELIS